MVFNFHIIINVTGFMGIWTQRKYHTELPSYCNYRLSWSL